MQRTALITGASAGIGQATARQFAKAGFDLYLIARRSERLAELKAELSALGRRVTVVSLDVTDRPAVEKFFQTEAGLKDVEVLVNSAGLAKGTELVDEANLSDWEAMIDTNVTALFSFTRLMLPLMKASKRGHIVNLGSVAGRWTYKGGAVYCATKAAVQAFSEGLRMDLIGSGIRVSNIEPGMVETEFSVVRLGNQRAADAVYKGMSPLSADDIAETILWCVQRPARENIQQLVILPTDQAAVGQVHRNT
jgi:hypothetical protein